ncbi:MAG: hypothetical protein DMF56_20435 [Acidobacteria bacterium]|nr:MAG: hypothetical protein DMF56_20435 [Acidobacteriota bacterium]
MNDKHLATRARLILRELQIRRATFLHAWMAEYIAECLDVLEKDPTNTEVKDRCAGTIARLWQAYVEDRRQSLAQAGDVYRTRACLTDDVLAELRVELSSNADTAKAGSFESSVHFRHLTALEEQVLEVYGASAALREGRDKMGAPDKSTSDNSGMVELLAELRKETKITGQRIAVAVFPEFGNLDLEDVDAVERTAMIALRAIDRARRKRLGDDTSSIAKERASAKGRSSKSRAHKSGPSKGRAKKK